MLNGDIDLAAATKSAAGSVLYAFTHLRRTLGEKKVIQTTDMWSILDQLKDKNVDVTVLHAREDELISFTDSETRAQQRPWITFMPTLGHHNNVYEPPVGEFIEQALRIS